MVQALVWVLAILLGLVLPWSLGPEWAGPVWACVAVVIVFAFIVHPKQCAYLVPFGRRRPVLSTLIASVLGAVVFGGLWLLVLRTNERSKLKSAAGSTATPQGTAFRLHIDRALYGEATAHDFMVTMDVTIVNTGIPSIAKGFSVSFKLADGRELPGSIVPIDPGHEVQFGKQGEVLHRRNGNDYLPRIALVAPIPTNGAVSGFIMAIARDVTQEQMRGSEVRLEVRDAQDNKYQTSYTQNAANEEFHLRPNKPPDGHKPKKHSR